jgi:S-adenosylmethionine:diacylglycerol 3-amino-3-carboxypropyl transferase
MLTLLAIVVCWFVLNGLFFAWMAFGRRSARTEAEIRAAHWSP